MNALHSKKVEAEKNAYLNNLFDSLPEKSKFLNGDLAAKSRALHKVLIPIYIMKYYTKKTYISGYLEVIMTNIIESESLFFLGFQNSAFSSLRSALESSFKFLYYEYHPVERMLHLDNGHLLTSKEYREFIYSCPFLKQISFFSKEVIEQLWTNLCKYVHCDLSAIKKMTLVSHVSLSVIEKEDEFSKLLHTMKSISKVIIAIFFAVDPNWAQNIEKAYYDAIFEAYTKDEQNELRKYIKIY